MRLGSFKACVAPRRNPSSAEPARRRHRHRRFHIRPEALGQDYHCFDVFPVAAPDHAFAELGSAAETAANTELFLEKDFRHQTARHGLWLVIETGLWLLVVVEVAWTIHLFLQVTLGWLWPS